MFTNSRDKKPLDDRAIHGITRFVAERRLSRRRQWRLIASKSSPAEIYSPRKQTFVRNRQPSTIARRYPRAAWHKLVLPSAGCSSWQPVQPTADPRAKQAEFAESLDVQAEPTADPTFARRPRALVVETLYSRLVGASFLHSRCGTGVEPVTLGSVTDALPIELTTWSFNSLR